MQTIRIACEGARTVPISSLVHFQGDLKELSKENYEKAKQSLVRLGFSEPISVWESEGKLNILNGHQRVRVLTKMQEEGWKIPELPINLVEAKDIQEAKRKVLALTSQYGEMTKQGLYEFIQDLGVNPEELAATYHFADLDIPDFLQEFYQDQADQGDVSQFGSAGGDPLRTLGSASSHVRMVQLFFNDANHPEFIEKMEDLAKVYGKDNLTDNIMEMVREVHSAKFQN